MRARIAFTLLTSDMIISSNILAGRSLGGSNWLICMNLMLTVHYATTFGKASNDYAVQDTKQRVVHWNRRIDSRALTSSLLTAEGPLVTSNYPCDTKKILQIAGPRNWPTHYCFDMAFSDGCSLHPAFSTSYDIHAIQAVLNLWNPAWLPAILSSLRRRNHRVCLWLCNAASRSPPPHILFVTVGLRAYRALIPAL